MAKILLDSNVWISFLMRKDSQHNKALNIVLSLDFENVFIHDFLLLEIVSVLRLRTNAKFAAQALNYIIDLDIKDLNIQDLQSYTKHAKDLVLQSKYPKLSFVDLFLLAASQKYEVITFDKNLKRAINSYGKKRSK